VRAGLGLVVEEAPAALADQDLTRLAHLVEALRRQGHPAARADAIAADQCHRQAGPPLEEPPVLAQEVAGHLAGDALPFAPGNLQAPPRPPHPSAGGRPRAPRPRLRRPEPRLALDPLAPEPLLELHEPEYLLLEPVLLDLGPLDLGQRGGVLLVRLHLVQLRL